MQAGLPLAMSGKRKAGPGNKHRIAKGGGKTWWWWHKGSIWRFSKGPDAEPVGDWQELGNDDFIDHSTCGLVRGCALRRVVLHFHE